MRSCICAGVVSYMLPNESFKAYLLTHTVAARSSPPKYSFDAATASL